MATLTVTPTALGSYSAKVYNMTLVAGDRYHILHGLGATPHEVQIALRSHPNASLPLQVIVGSYDATILWVDAGPPNSGTGAGDITIRRAHTVIL